MSTRATFYFLGLMALASLLGGSCLARAQEAGNPVTSNSALDDAVRELREQVRELQIAVEEMRSENGRMREESAELRRELEGVHTTGGKAVPHDQPPNERAREHAASLEEQYQLLSGKIDDQYQTKVESASKYRMRISGIVLVNLFSNVGSVDNIDVPTLAYGSGTGYSNGSSGATVRQSEIGFEVFGPRVAGAKTRAELQMDFGGGFPETPNGVTTGLLRLRTGTVHLDWTNTSVIAGQDSLFFSPNSPTSFASLTLPALAYAGNLWGWNPQVRVEHRFSLGEESSLTVQAGILDPLSGERPGEIPYRIAGPGEASRQPAFAGRVGWTSSAVGQPLRLGLGGYYSRQNYGFDRNVDAWAGMADLEVPLGHQFFVSGELYRGRGLGGIYGGIGRSVLFSGSPGSASAEVRGLNAVGGWAQLKYQPASKVEFNAAYGLDNSYAADLRAFPYAEAYADPSLARNTGGFANVIIRPRSDLLFSAEYRHLRTFAINTGPNSAQHVNLMMGVLF